MNVRVISILLSVATAGSLCAQESEPELPRASFAEASERVHQQLAEALAELSELRKEIAAEKIPLSRRVGDLESKLSEARLRYQQTTRLVDSRALDLSNLRKKISARQEEARYVSDLLTDYLRNFESRLHIAEVQRYREPIERAKLAGENDTLTGSEAFDAQLALLSASIERLDEALGGTRFDGTSVDADGVVNDGTFALIGPAALFRSADGQDVGTAQQRLGSLEPATIGFARPEHAEAAVAVIDRGAGDFPLDPTLENAAKLEATEDTFFEHVQKGGTVMIPIFALATAALLVALYKWIVLAMTRTPSRKQVEALLEDVAAHNQESAGLRARTMKGPVGAMLASGVEHLREPRELIEEVMYETVLTTKLRLQRMLPFVAISAAAAPLLGLLGTVTGIIHTFTLITVVGSGDVKTLSGGISEALITTKFGLIVAIPSLLLHAYLARKARGIIGRMESTAVAFVNQVSKTPMHRERAPTRTDQMTVAMPDPALVREQVTAILGEILSPLGLAGPGAHGSGEKADGTPPLDVRRSPAKEASA